MDPIYCYGVIGNIKEPPFFINTQDYRQLFQPAWRNACNRVSPSRPGTCTPSSVVMLSPASMALMTMMSRTDASAIKVINRYPAPSTASNAGSGHKGMRYGCARSCSSTRLISALSATIRYTSMISSTLNEVRSARLELKLSSAEGIARNSVANQGESQGG